MECRLPDDQDISLSSWPGSRGFQVDSNARLRPFTERCIAQPAAFKQRLFGCVLIGSGDVGVAGRFAYSTAIFLSDGIQFCNTGTLEKTVGGSRCIDVRLCNLRFHEPHLQEAL